MDSVSTNGNKHAASNRTEQFVTMRVNGQLFGIGVKQVRDVLLPQPTTPVPLAAKEIAGVLNLRGCIVTAIDMRKRLLIPASDINEKNMSVVVEYQDDLYSLIVDSIGDVLDLDISGFSAHPDTLSQEWQAISLGVFILENELLIAVDVEKLLDIG
jgi:purine-binding chemotaxis protein CheW